ncbi:MAG: creatininase family protein [Ardenticatenaceae bacterium]|nr:creatininase family protein [Ardenticatenaceae bacterium]
MGTGEYGRSRPRRHFTHLSLRVSTHRQAFAGTLNVQGRAFEDFWLAVVDGLVGRGFDRFYLMSGHGGNCSFWSTW